MMVHLNKILAGLGVLGVGGSVLAFVRGEGNAGIEAAAWVAAFFLGLMLLTFFLAKHAASQFFAKIEGIPAAEWYKDIEAAAQRIPTQEWYERLDRRMDDGDEFREKVHNEIAQFERRIGRLEGKVGIER